MTGSTPITALSCEVGLLGRTSGQLALRICSGPDAGSTIVIAAQKCTIGSADECDLRLHGPGFDPCHCLVLRGDQRTVIRRRSPRTRLNGRVFEDAFLRAGDRLRLGTLEFEVAAGDEPPLVAAEVAERLTAQLTEMQRQLAELEHDRRQLQVSAETREQEREAEQARTAQYWQQAEQTARATIARREEELAELRGHAAQLEQQLAKCEEALRAAVAETNQHSLEAKDFHRQIAQLHDQLGQHEQIAAAMRYELEGLRQAQEQCEESLVKQMLLEQQVDQLRSELEQQQEAARTAEEQWERQRCEWQLQLDTLQTAALARAAVEATERRGEPSASERLPAERSVTDSASPDSPAIAWASIASIEPPAEPALPSPLENVAERSPDDEQGDLDEARRPRSGEEVAEPEGQSASSVAEVLARLKAAGKWHDDESDEIHDVEDQGADRQSDCADSPDERATARMALLRSPAADGIPASKESSGDEELSDEDASIQNYLDSLLHRVRGRQETPPADLTQVAPHIQCEIPIPVARRRTEPTAYVRRETAPEDRMGLDAMRELANESARSAIDTHQHKVTVEKIRSSWAYAALSVFGFLWGTAAWAILSEVSPGFGLFGAGLGYGIAGLFTLLALVHRIRASGQATP